MIRKHGNIVLKTKLLPCLLASHNPLINPQRTKNCPKDVFFLNGQQFLMVAGNKIIMLLKLAILVGF